MPEFPDVEAFKRRGRVASVRPDDKRLLGNFRSASSVGASCTADGGASIVSWVRNPAPGSRRRVRAAALGLEGCGRLSYTSRRRLGHVDSSMASTISSAERAWGRTHSAWTRTGLAFARRTSNIHRDEVLFQAGVRPTTPVSRLDKRRRSILVRAMQRSCVGPSRPGLPRPACPADSSRRTGGRAQQRLLYDLPAAERLSVPAPTQV